MLVLFFSIIGLFIGSFLNVVIDRLPREETIFVGRSHCDFCHHELAWYDLVPLFSFLFLSGKCRYCKKFIGWKYPVIELTTGFMFALTSILISTGSLVYLCIMLGIVSCLLVIFFIDLFSGIIPDSMLITLGVLAFLRILLLHQAFLPIVLTILGAGIFFVSIFLATRGKGMGFGDVKYACIMGLLLPFPFIIPALYIAFLTGALIALILVMEGKKAMKSTIAFGPFLVVGTIVDIFWGMHLWTLFQKILGL